MPSAFQQQLAADADEVFLNLEEFAETVAIAGRELPAVVDEESAYDMRGVSGQRRTPGMAPEIPSRGIKVWVKTDGLPAEADANGTVEFRGQHCFIVTREDSFGGVTLLTLARNGF